MTAIYGAAITASGTQSVPVLADPALAFVAPGLNRYAAAELLAQPLGAYFGGPVRVQVDSVRAVRHRPGLRCLIEYDLRVQRKGSSPEPMTLLGKVGARAMDVRSYQLQSRLWSNGFSADDPAGVSVPEPIAPVPELRMWLQRKVTGVSPLPFLRSDDAAPVATRIADALHRLHAAPGRPERVHTVTDELGILRKRLEALAQERPRLRRRLETILSACESAAASLGDRELVGIHRDFYQDQVLIDFDRIWILDLDLFCIGDPALDVGNFVAHLIEFGLRSEGNASAFEVAEGALIDRFCENRRNAREQSFVQTYVTLSLVRHIQISTRFPERIPYTERIIQLCEHRLGLRTKR